MTPDGEVRHGAHVTEITGLLTLPEGWPDGMRLMARTERPHPRHRKQASHVERQREQRFQATATDLPGYRYPKLDAFGRNHAVVESTIKDGKDLGLRRLPGYDCWPSTTTSNCAAPARPPYAERYSTCPPASLAAPANG